MPYPEQVLSLAPNIDGSSSSIEKGPILRNPGVAVSLNSQEKTHLADPNQRKEKHTPKPKRRKTKRSGKWTEAEERYARCLISSYATGLFELPRGQTLRSFIASKLKCSPMRVTKKFPGTGSVMRQQAVSSINKTTIQPTTDVEVFAQDYMTNQEQAFLASIKLGRNTNSSSAGQSTHEPSKTSTVQQNRQRNIVEAVEKTPNGTFAMAPVSHPVPTMIPPNFPPAVSALSHLNIAALVHRADLLQNVIAMNMGSATVVPPTIVHSTPPPVASLQQIQSMILQNVLEQLQAKQREEQQQQAMAGILNQLLSHSSHHVPLSTSVTNRQIEGAADFINFLTSVQKANNNK